MGNWFTDTREAWIVECVTIFGFINRNHIMRKFRVSTPQASTDLKNVMRKHPNLMAYNKSAKRYELANATKGPKA